MPPRKKPSTAPTHTPPTEPVAITPITIQKRHPLGAIDFSDPEPTHSTEVPPLQDFQDADPERQPKGRLAPGVAAREFVEFVTGKPLPEDQPNPDAVPVKLSEDLIRSMARQGLATILYHCRRGNLRAAIYLVDRCLGTPDAPFQEKVKKMTREEAKLALANALRLANVPQVQITEIIETSTRVLPAFTPPDPASLKTEREGR